MELYIGGYAQGKTEYVRHLYPEALILEQYAGEKQEGVLVWNHFHLAVKNMLAQGMDKEAILALVEKAYSSCEKLVVVSDEIGNGIVPMEKEDRIRREETGRILCKIAERADKVERIICGIAQRIK